MKILAVVSYKGTNYAGWQKQPNALSIQEVIEDKLSQIFNRPISIYGAGRTDAGVHALGQRFHFDINETDVDLDRLIYSLNSMLPVDIKIDDMEEVDTDFHARYNAKEKIYSYSFVLEDKDVFLNEIMYVCPYEL
ncbi:MAG: tRNA pseudouridine(38-40) synthase TruA, partial [Bacilli bacterium]|nr:tRNA pseudouridine(38-40) synthase TruA [Bacilli bacterium]